jgi:hypothetical protein
VQLKGFTIQTDQSRQGGGEGSAPEPVFRKGTATRSSAPRSVRREEARILEPPAFEIRARAFLAAKPVTT